ncbi:hypothetical protein [Parasitella parasitica]|uniref:Uncharacterized protein n=1 Tax=Parasitella parasitica TaxID=35722 RepID=A0A0B7N533_9FUNG|nr:hypothetical protein [Parasitella parasitica]
MAEQEVATTLNGVEDPRTFIETKLQDSLVHIYDSTRIGNDIKTVNNKLQSLLAIRNQLAKDSNNSVPDLRNMNRTIEELQKEIETKQAEMRTAEKQVIKGFQDILQFIMNKASNDVASVKTSMAGTLSQFSNSLLKGFEQKIEDIKQHLMAIDELKMDRSEKNDIQGTIDAFKTHIVELQKNQIETVKGVTEKQYAALSAHFNERLESVNPESIAKRVQQQVMESLDSKFKQQMQTLEVANKGIFTQGGNAIVSDTIAQSVIDQVKAHLTPDSLKSIISTLPEYQALQSLRPEQIPVSEAIKKIITDLQQEVNDLKTQGHSTRALVNNLVDRNVSLTDKEAIHAQHSAALIHIEEMQKNIQLMHNNMKMMETVMSVQAKRIEETAASSSQSTVSRKRARTDEDGGLIDQKEEHSNEKVLERVVEMETRHQKLLDFILQFKDTVLDETFPDRLSAAFKKFQDIMLNHQTFIAFLVDPFSTSKSLHSTESVSIPQQSSAQESPVLNPAMLDAISLLVKQTAEEISSPLKEKIKALEDKLNAKQH